MTFRPLRAIVGLAAVATLACAAAASAQTRTTTVIADFNHRIAAYVELTNQLTKHVPPLKRTGDPAEIASRETAMGAAIRAGRADARRGDVFAAPIARVFRRAIKLDYRQRPKRAQKVMRDEIPHFHPKIGQTYPSEWPLATFPATLLAEMPPLPAGLEYRLLSEALILLDVKANIIVDFILDVF